ncbi:uncharacterized protein LOC107265876 isoform X2 [Cephus cinctus]|nr:uncharacterized protein LOC107265876 isoform X2 [Cephus cinctus]XP_024938873.1 uncharacterized protein LOC107265876 isoform X2 [Cephus cinctus]
MTLTGAEVVVHTDVNEVSLTNLKVSSSKAGDSRERTKRYGFDYCFDSSEPDSEKYATQEKIYETLGNSVLDAVFAGYNSCLVAYGQSASGKTYSMMGPKDDPGLTPRLCEGLFKRILNEEKSDRTYQTSISYLEIYNERVRDLLKPSSSSSGLRVREHPRLGPYVQGLTRHAVRTLGSLMSYVEEGSKARKTASTLQNPSSSRSHALLTVSLSPEGDNGHPSNPTEKRNIPRGSKLHLVDLAGSESAATCSGIHRLKEGANINKSLVALGNVISALAERGATGSGPGRRFIPYRDSALTWLLKDALGGNATTIMLATISPASGSYNETAHTLRFAQRAQSVVNRPVVNEDPVARIIRELRAEVARLKSLLSEKSVETADRTICCCKTSREEDKGPQGLEETQASYEEEAEEDRKENQKDNSILEKIGNFWNITNYPIRKYNSNESLIARDDITSTPLRRYGSLDVLGSERGFRNHDYNRASISEIISHEVNESVFVDIPTLVAVLIKPDDSLQDQSTQIEEIYSDGVPDHSVDVDLLDQANLDEVPSSDLYLVHTGKPEESDNIENLTDSTKSKFENISNDTIHNDLSASDFYTSESTKIKLKKQDSIDIALPARKSTNLHTSKKFGSVEGLQKKPLPYNLLQRSHTSLEKRPANSDKIKKLNNIKEVEDQKSAKLGSVVRTIGSSFGKDLQRKVSNDSDKNCKYNSTTQKAKNLVRKQSSDSLKRKTSKDSSSSSSKEDQIIISNLARDRLRRKGSLDQETSIRTHTPIQRSNRRAEIVAAVTQRLYSSKKNSEEITATATGSEFRSPESSDVKMASTTRMRLQEISRKMLAKRRRICVDTQTDNVATVRVKDSASLTDDVRISCKDIGILTDFHEDCESVSSSPSPVLRVKEMATLTERDKRSTTRCKDIATLTDDYEEDFGMHSSRNDSGILSDDAMNYAESNFSCGETSDLCADAKSRCCTRNVEFTENSTNTLETPETPGVSVQTGIEIEEKRIISKNCTSQCCHKVRECCGVPIIRNVEKNVISISLPIDKISITIESPNTFESKIAIVEDSATTEKMKPGLKDSEVQTELKKALEKSTYTEEFNNTIFFNDISISSKPSQGDGKTFRIENIFQDPRSSGKSCPRIEILPDLTDNVSLKNSLILTNSVGTSFVPETRESSTEMERENNREDRFLSFFRTPRRRSLMNERLNHNARCAKRRSLSLSPRRAACTPGKCNYILPDSLSIQNPVKGIQLTTCGAKFDMDSVLRQDSNCSMSANDKLTPFENPGTINSLKPLEQPQCANINSTDGTLKEGKLAQKVVEDGVYSKTKADIAGLKSPVLVARMGESSHDADPNFSDDSLDLNESSVGNNNREMKSEGGDGAEGNENFCPPDVVAHTKKESPRCSSQTEEIEPSNAAQDFEDNTVDFPRTKPSLLKDNQIHDYKSLILGNGYLVTADTELADAHGGTGSENKNSCCTAKKKVSFSSSELVKDESPQSTSKYSSPGPKSIIKKKSDNRDASKVPRESSLRKFLSPLKKQEMKISKVPEYSIPHEKSMEMVCSSDPAESDHPVRNNRESECKKVRFSTSELFEETASDSDSYGDVVSDEETSNKEAQIFAEYLDEAVAFMRNLNSMNEYMSASNIFGKFLGHGEYKCCDSNDLDDYVIYKGRKVSLRDDTDEFLKDEDFEIPTESYENCLRGIERLESCIERTERHDKLLHEKYGIKIESSDTKSGLVESSTDSTGPSLGRSSTTRNLDLPITRESKPFNMEESDCNDKYNYILDNESRINNNFNKNLDDLEERIFNHLMDAANPDRCNTATKPRLHRSSKVSYTKSKSPASYSKIRKKYGNGSREPLVKKGSSSSYTREQSPRLYSDFTIGESKDLVTPECFLFMPPSMNNDRSSRRTGNQKVLPKMESSYDACSSSENIAASTESIDTASGSTKEKLKYPGSPRAKFLQLLSERRRIVQDSRTSDTY